MIKAFVEEKIFKEIDFTEEILKVGEYEACTFSDCLFSGVDLSNFSFTDCRFENCDLSMAVIKKTAFRGVKFVACKLLGLRFEDCNEFLFSANFEACQLNFVSFYGWSLPDTRFKDCNLNEVDFTSANMSGAAFENCDLSDALFENTNLEKCDFKTAINYRIDPEINKIQKAKFSMPGVVGLLRKYDIEIS